MTANENRLLEFVLGINDLKDMSIAETADFLELKTKVLAERRDTKIGFFNQLLEVIKRNRQ